jgi:acyl-CoA synthetase (AMP-forming)/AMP-acid ligase II
MTTPIFSDLPNGESLRGFDFRTVISRACARFGERPFLYFGDSVFSYADADRNSNAIANGLREFGVNARDHVALLLNNCPEIV